MGSDEECPSHIKKLKENFEEYQNRYNERKKNSINYYNDIKEKETFISNYRVFLSELNYQISSIKDQANITSSDIKNDKDEKNDSLNDLEEITNKINEFQNVLENQKTLLKNLENNFKMIQEQFDDINLKFQNKEKVNNELIANKINTLDKQLEENQQLLTKLEENKRLSEEKKIDIENELKKMQEITDKKITEIKTKNIETFQKIYIKKSNSSDSTNSKYLNSSMLFTIKNFTNVKNELKTTYLFRESANKKNEYELPLLLMKKWHEICYIKNDYDIHDITYELKAVGLPAFMNFNASSFIFEPDISINILLFEIDGKQAIYKFEKHFIYFNINLKNLESNKIHIRYKESPKNEKMTEEEKKFRNLYRIKEYGLLERLVGQLIGQKAKYILKNESDLEIVNFDNEFLIKTNDNEYQWGGIVPNGGKVTKVRMSKKEGIVHIYEKQKITTIDNTLIKNSNLKIPLGYIDGNNEIIKNEYDCNPKGQINLSKNNKNERIYDVYFKNINSYTAEFKLEKELKNKCKTTWVINLTNEEIDSLIPNDFKTNKALFNKKANEIIQEYDKEHKDDKVNIPEIAKIGKWIKKNIEYDFNYAGKNEITATQILYEKRGVCDHITKLFNALIYSLGYQVIYANGFAMNKKNTFGLKDGHAWSIINIDKNGTRWLPFDATWGIFTGKLPVTHVFKKIGNNGAIFLSEDNADIEQLYVKGNIK